MGYAIPIRAAQYGSGMPVYAGQRRQMGGNLFSTIGRFAMPLLKHILPIVKKLGKRAGKAALNLGTGLASDLFTGKAKQIPANFRKRGRAELNSISRQFIGRDVMREPDEEEEEQGGSGLKRLRRKPINMIQKHQVRKQKAIIAARKKRQANLI